MKITCKDYFLHSIFIFMYGWVKYVPSPVGDWLRNICVRPFLLECGKFRIYEGVTFWYPYRIRIGTNVTLNEWVYLSGFGGLKIGNDVRIGHRVSIITSDHAHSDIRKPIFEQGLVSEQVTIEDDVWIGCNATILKGVRIGKGAVVAAGAVVTKDVLPFSIVAGVPARLISRRGQDSGQDGGRLTELAIEDFSSRSLTPSERGLWTDFVARNSGNYCQVLEWQRVLAVSYRLETHFLMFFDAGIPVGLLPLAVIPSLFSRKAVSLPFCNYGGLLVAGNFDKQRVLQSALDYLGARGIARIEFRDLRGLADGKSSSEVTLLLDLPETQELLWKNVGDKARNQVRKAERAGLAAHWGPDQAGDLYDIYAENMGRLGTPVHARAFVDGILDAFGERADVLTVRLGGQAVAAMLVLKHDDTWADPIASSRVEFKHLNANMLLYWEALRQAMLSGAKRFDFGRSKKESGTYRFKRQWGAREAPLDYYTYVDGVRVESASTDAYRGGKAALFAKFWTRLPSSFQRLVGPEIRRFIP
jgi:FemAB-related protein (PEP-CTERM system-associated)